MQGVYTGANAITFGANQIAGVEFIDVVPKNPSGKLLRRLLRDQLKQLLAQGKVKLIRPGSKKGQVKL